MFHIGRRCQLRGWWNRSFPDSYVWWSLNVTYCRSRGKSVFNVMQKCFKIGQRPHCNIVDVQTQASRRCGQKMKAFDQSHGGHNIAAVEKHMNEAEDGLSKNKIDFWSEDSLGSVADARDGFSQQRMGISINHRKPTAKPSARSRGIVFSVSSLSLDSPSIDGLQADSAFSGALGQRRWHGGALNLMDWVTWAGNSVASASTLTFAATTRSHQMEMKTERDVEKMLIYGQHIDVWWGLPLVAMSH